MEKFILEEENDTFGRPCVSAGSTCVMNVVVVIAIVHKKTYLLLHQSERKDKPNHV